MHQSFKMRLSALPPFWDGHSQTEPDGVWIAPSLCLSSLTQSPPCISVSVAWGPLWSQVLLSQLISAAHVTAPLLEPVFSPIPYAVAWTEINICEFQVSTPAIKFMIFMCLLKKWAGAWDFQQCGMCDQQSLRLACAYAQSDQSLC